MAQCQVEGAISSSKEQLQTHYDRFHYRRGLSNSSSTDAQEYFREPLLLPRAINRSKPFTDFNDAVGFSQYSVGANHQPVGVATAGFDNMVHDVNDTVGQLQIPVNTMASLATSTPIQTTSSSGDATGDVATSTTDAQNKTCVHCGAQFRRNPDLRRHLRSHDPTKRVYHCHVPKCSYKGSYRRDKLADHLEKRHTGTIE